MIRCVWMTETRPSATNEHCCLPPVMHFGLHWHCVLYSVIVDIQVFSLLQSWVSVQHTDYRFQEGNPLISTASGPQHFIGELLSELSKAGWQVSDVRRGVMHGTLA